MYCPNCGQENSDNEIICQRCGNLLNAEKTNVEQEKIEKVPNGIVGAVLGALIGGIVIVLLYQLELVSTWSGVLLAFCTLKGYELLGGKLSKLGVGISVLLILLMPICAYLISMGIALSNEWQDIMPGMTMFQGVQVLFELMEAEPEVKDAVITDLVQLYLFTGAGVALYFAITKMNTKKKAK